MILTIWIALTVISLILITLGLFKPEHTELSIIGFLFLFLLSFPILNGSLEYSTGADITTSLNFTSGTTSTTLTERYSTYSSKPIGYWMATLSGFGVVVMIFSIKGRNND